MTHPEERWTRRNNREGILFTNQNSITIYSNKKRGKQKGSITNC